MFCIFSSLNSKKGVLQSCLLYSYKYNPKLLSNQVGERDKINVKKEVFF